MVLLSCLHLFFPVVLLHCAADVFCFISFDLLNPFSTSYNLKIDLSSQTEKKSVYGCCLAPFKCASY